jgi:hypothetical protein
VAIDCGEKDPNGNYSRIITGERALICKITKSVGAARDENVERGNSGDEE